MIFYWFYYIVLVKALNILLLSGTVIGCVIFTAFISHAEKQAFISHAEKEVKTKLKCLLGLLNLFHLCFLIIINLNFANVFCYCIE